MPETDFCEVEISKNTSTCFLRARCIFNFSLSCGVSFFAASLPAFDEVGVLKLADELFAGLKNHMKLLQLMSKIRQSKI